MRERIGAEADSLEKCEEPGGPERDGILALLSTVLGLGRDSLSASASARRLLKTFGTAAALTQASLEEIRVRGKLSARQASSLRAALLLGQRLCSSPLKPGEKFSNSRDIFRNYRARFFAANKEHFFSLHLNSKNRLIREALVSVGSLSTSVVHPREVFAAAVRDSAAAVLFLHNHPSGDPTPSKEDRECTERLCRAGRILGIRVLDHIIVGHDEYFSFADAGLLTDTEL